jgi:uncharacterized protein YigE (DUF2233 family)
MFMNSQEKGQSRAQKRKGVGLEKQNWFVVIVSQQPVNPKVYGSVNGVRTPGA